MRVHVLPLTLTAIGLCAGAVGPQDELVCKAGAASVK